ncbi:MAG: hypothetical protein LBU28_05845 [Spirochaetaceae bacterium]|nr:hypothetical protein [Spirochaetaceae bacterium]
MDPEIAALLGTVSVPAKPAVHDSDIFFDKSERKQGRTADSETDVEASGFPAVTKRFEEKPHGVFNDPNYYKQILANEGDGAQRIHTILQKYLNTKDPKDRSVFRQQLSTAFWDFLAGVARKAPGKIAAPKKFLLRFGILHPTFLDIEDRDTFAKAVVENELSQPIYYVDEWLKAVGTGVIQPSTTDEVQVSRSNTSGHLQQLLEKANGKLEGARGLLKAKHGERINLEKALLERIQNIMQHGHMEGLPDISACYDEGQKRAFTEVQDVLKSMLKSDRELETFSRDFYQAQEDVNTIQAKLAEEGGLPQADVQAVDTEFSTIRQMAKMTIGRQGNQFPILTREYFHSLPNDIGLRENIMSLLSRIESIDPEAFHRIYKNKVNRIVPYVILLPNYGDVGMCWEPFSRLNRATSRGRIAVPMYPKNLTIALLSAVADLRWQVAKEKAAYYWMEEGLTGNYYQYFSSRKIKGDLKACFIDDYIVWMTKESEGTQKLDKEVRSIFWRYMPFAQPVKDKLKTRSLIYQELYQRDVNRSMSDGY